MHPIDVNRLAEPEPLPFPAPYTYDGPYAGCYDCAAGGIDKRHAYLLHDVLMSWQFANALEIGSLNGASTAAMVEAANRKPSIQVCICETAPQPSLFNVLGNQKNNNVFLSTLPSVAVLQLDGEFEFIFVDGAHDLASVSGELEELLRLKPLCIMAHDTNSTDSGISLCDGAKYLRETLRKHPDYRGKCIEDAVRRRGEHTERGMFLAARDEALFAVAQECYARWCPILEAATV